MKQLAGFDVRPGPDRNFVLRLEDEDGAVTEVSASVDQLDTMVDAIDDLLADHDELGYDGDTYQKPLG